MGDFKNIVFLDIINALTDLKEHILKISGQYLYFWPSYKHMSHLSQNVTHTLDKVTLLKFILDR